MSGPKEPTEEEILEYFYRVTARWGGMIPEEMRRYEAIRQLIEERPGVTEEMNRLFESHRSKDKITCPETCFCWDVEAYLTSQEAGEKVKAVGEEGR